MTVFLIKNLDSNYDSQGSVELIKNLDSNGALKNTTVIQNNFEGQIVSVDKFTPTTDLFLNAFFYDGFGKRIKTVNTKGAATTNSYSFYGQNGKLMYSYKDGNHTDYIFLGSKLVARTETKPESVPRVKHMHYKPFGEVVEGDEGKIGYTGHKFDTDLGLNYMQARYYDPVIGRFYSNDPISVRDVHSFNRYAYANNNPYRYVDPFGMSVHDPFSPPEKEDCGCSSLKIPNMFKDSEESDDSGSEDGGDPEIKRQKQNEHIEGTPNHKNRSKQAESPEDLPSTWDNPEEADSLTTEAWNRGEIVKGNPNVKILDFGRRVGTKGDKSFGQKAVKVVRDGKGKIHGTPTGTLRQ
jgi:RHS repeat-associated protein